jgi:hypothetical protein
LNKIQVEEIPIVKELITKKLVPEKSVFQKYEDLKNQDKIKVS